MRALKKKDIVVHEQILTREGNRPIQVTSIPFQNEMGDWLVAEINVDITERKQAEEKIRQSLLEKEALLREIHHRVKNNLQIISSLLSTQVGRVTEPAARDALRECQTRVLAIALIHQNLHQSETYLDVPFAEYVRSLGATVLRATRATDRAVDLVFDLEDITLPVDHAVPCGLILNELITNALKHAFVGRKTGVVRVVLRSLPEHRISLSVSDDGVGLPEELGSQLEHATTMGLQLVRTLALQLDATLEIARGGGTSFTITFSLAKTAPRAG
jgi:two-component sensor histidine kinase